MFRDICKIFASFPQFSTAKRPISGSIVCTSRFSYYTQKKQRRCSYRLLAGLKGKADQGHLSTFFTPSSICALRAIAFEPCRSPGFREQERFWSTNLGKKSWYCISSNVAETRYQKGCSNHFVWPSDDMAPATTVLWWPFSKGYLGGNNINV